MTLTLAGNDTGIAFTAGAGTCEVGDWWGVRVRGSAADAVETLTAAPPDGIRHAIAPLAVVDIGKGAVLTDCRPTFPSLAELANNSTCTVTAFPGDDLQAKLDLLPATGGGLCLAAGCFGLTPPLNVFGKPRVVITGVGPATVLATTNSEAALVATGVDDIEVTYLRVETAIPEGVASPPGDPGLMGGLSFLGGDGIRVHDVEVHVPDSVGKSQLAIYVAPDVSAGDPGMVEICGNRLEVGDQQVGILVASAASTRISDNRVSLAAAGSVFWPNRLVARQLGAFVASHISAAKAQPAPGPAPGPGPAPAPAGPAAAGSLIFRNRPGPGDQPRQRGQPVHRRDHPDPASDQRLRQEHVGDPTGPRTVLGGRHRTLRRRECDRAAPGGDRRGECVLHRGGCAQCALDGSGDRRRRLPGTARPDGNLVHGAVGLNP